MSSITPRIRAWMQRGRAKIKVKRELAGAAAVARHFRRSPRDFLAKAREFVARLQQEQDLAAGVAPLQPVYDDLPAVGFRNVAVIDRPAALDVLIPGLQKQHLSGGPNTALNLTYRVAAAGVPVRYFSTDLPHDDEEALRRHCAGLTDVAERLPNVEFASMHDCGTPTPIGRRDMLFSTAWWTAQYAQHILGRTQRDAFFYMIQDFEPRSARNSPGCVRSSPGCGAASLGAPPPLSGPWAARCAPRSSAPGQIDLSDDPEAPCRRCVGAVRLTCPT